MREMEKNQLKEKREEEQQQEEDGEEEDDDDQELHIFPRVRADSHNNSNSNNINNSNNNTLNNNNSNRIGEEDMTRSLTLSAFTGSMENLSILHNNDNDDDEDEDDNLKNPKYLMFEGQKVDCKALLRNYK